MSNNERIVQNLISLEAWHIPLEFNSKSPLHVALSFSDARYSGDADTPIEFRVQLRRATLVIMCDENIKVPLSTRVREHPSRKRTVKSSAGAGATLRHAEDRSLELSGGAENALPKFNATKSLHQSQSIDQSADTRHEVEEEITQTIQMIYQSAQTEHRWECKPIYGKTLQGSAHGGASHLLELQPTVRKNLADLGIRVLVRCKAEDFDISDISLKPSFMEKFRGPDIDRRLRMAKEVIKQKLAEAELGDVSLDTNFSDVVLADIMAVPE